MADFKLTEEQERLVHDLVAYYESNSGRIKRLLDSLHGFISDAESLNQLGKGFALDIPQERGSREYS
jgi:hypothetical protein